MRKTDYNECLEADKMAHDGVEAPKAKPLKVIGSYFGNGFAMPPVVISE